MEIIIASTNKNKIREYRELLKPLGFEVISLIDLNFNDEIIEDGDSFAKNAYIKAITIAKKYNKAVISDDSGLEIEALNNFPGIYSARFMGETTDYSLKNAELIRRLENKKNRTAYFTASITYVDQNLDYKIFTYRLKGKVVESPKGDQGFGYDPIFYLPKYNKTLAEMDLELKLKVSHRGQASKMLIKYLKKYK